MAKLIILDWKRKHSDHKQTFVYDLLCIAETGYLPEKKNTNILLERRLNSASTLKYIICTHVLCEILIVRFMHFRICFM